MTTSDNNTYPPSNSQTRTRLDSPRYSHTDDQAEKAMDYVERGNESGEGRNKLGELLEQMLEGRRNIEDWRVSSSSVAVDILDEHDHSSANYHRSELPYNRYCLKCRNQTIYFEESAWRQFLKKVDMPAKFVQRLHKENEGLLVRNMQHCFQMKAPDYLLRLRRTRDNQGREILYLRGLLDIEYNRLDNIYLIDPILRLAQEKRLQIRNILSDQNNLTVHLVSPNQRDLLEKVRDKVLTGISIVNSEVGSESALFVEAYYERLICTNGMTVRDKQKIKAPKKLSEMLHSQYSYSEELPPYPLPKHQEEKVYSFLRNAWNRLQEGTKQDLDEMRAGMQELLDKRISFEDERDVRNHINAMLHTSGLRTQLGISIDGIYRAYLKELKDFGSTQDSALILYNAFTRYASTLAVPDEEEERHLVERRRGRPIRLTFRDRMRLTNNLTSRSYRLFPKSLNWEKVIQYARSPRMKIMHPPSMESKRW